MDTSKARTWAAKGATAILILGLLAAPALAEDACPVAPTPSITLPHLRSAVSHGMEAIVVALGSSSTQGAMASDLAHSYPAVLQTALSASLRPTTDTGSSDRVLASSGYGTPPTT